MENEKTINREFFSDSMDSCNKQICCEIPEGFTKIESKAFYDWLSCKYVIIPSSVKEIADDALLWDNIHLVISNHSFFESHKYSFSVIPYVNYEISKIIISLFEKIENIDSKVDIHTDDIDSKKGMINKEVDTILQELDLKIQDLQSKKEALDHEYCDLFKQIDGNSKCLKDINEKINKMAKEAFIKLDGDLIRAKINIDNYVEQLGNKADEYRSDLKQITKSIEKEKKKIIQSIEKEKKQMVDSISQMVLDKVCEENPYKMITIVINDKKIQSDKPKIFHYQLEDVIKLVAAGFNPLLVGPAGCGKNVIIEQVADYFGWKFFYVNDVTEEYKVMGFVDANGHYCKTQFYEAFTNGGFIMIDELDQSNAAALLAINSAIGTGYHEYASFPDGQLYPKHSDFHIAAAANTYGNGANMLYCGRNQLDVASLNRFTPIFIDYDCNLESSLVSTQDFLPLYWKVRKIVEANRIRQVISTRNIVNADKMISNKLFEISKVFDFTLTQGMSNEDLRIILNDLGKTSSTGSFENQFHNYLRKVKKISMSEY